RNVVERLVILSTGPAIGEDTVQRVLAAESVRAETTHPPVFDQEDFREAVLAFEKEFLTQKLRENEFNVSRTAEKLGLDRTSIHRKMKQLGITAEGGRR
ncbi:MAG: sigma-54-dependent Fis family transcriptional regulator, partial [Deltaproteobacteria bacterium]|nr:sigma-54-dependent Fis family transcriptional regulator [Deltaproteobacteria bacterium]